MKKVIWFVILCLAIGSGAVYAQDLRIDFSQTNGPVQEGYQAYRADHEVAATFSAQSFSAFGATVTILPTWAAGATPQAMQMIDRGGDDGVEAPDLTRDWIGTDGRQPGDPMTLTITGLPAGTYEWVSLHSDSQDQTGIFDVTVNDASGSATTTDIDISDSNAGTLLLADMTTFTTTIVSNGTDPVTLVFERTSSIDPVANAFFLMNSFELTALSTGNAMMPSPPDQATDVPRDDVVLSWSPAPEAVSHDVYLGTDREEVEQGVVDGSAHQGRQSQTSFEVSRLELGQTYYWRVDEVSSDGSVVEGNVWTFTAEPVAYVLTDVNATASHASEPGVGPENTVDGSGLNEEGQHSVADGDMWLVEPGEGEPVWIQFDFDRVYKLAEARIWNYNMLYEFILGFGLQDVTIEYATDANDWVVLGDFQLARGASQATYTGQVIDLGGIGAKSIRINAVSNYGGIKYALSEVQFLYIPAHAREPQPESGATEVGPDVVLSWRAGREAASHDVYLSTDEQAVIDGSAPVQTAATNSLAPDGLSLGQTYYWRVDEVNTAEAISTWKGDVWSFTTTPVIPVEGFEDYTGEEGQEVFSSWIDGYGIVGNGSQVGHNDPPYVEETIVHGGEQAMPYSYGNDGAATSEAVYRLPEPQNWTTNGVKAMMLWFYGDPANTASQMYVKVNGTKVYYDGDPANLLLKPWQLWYVDLSALASANLNRVTELAIGFEGGQGFVIFDDIALSPAERKVVTPVEPDAAGLLAHWAFEGDAVDSTGGDSGTLVGTPQFAAGQTGQAIVLDGGGDYVQVEGSYTLAEYSYAVWFRVDGGTGARDILSAYTATGGHGIILEMSDTGTLRYLHRPVTAISGPSDIRVANATFDDGGWYHVAVVKSADAMTLYVNGEVLGTVDEAGAFDQPLTKLSMGVLRDEDLQRYFAGAFDEAYLYTRPLSQGEIAWLAGRTQPFSTP